MSTMSVYKPHSTYNSLIHLDLPQVDWVSAGREGRSRSERMRAMQVTTQPANTWTRALR